MGIVNEGAMNMDIQIPIQVPAFKSLDMYLEVELSDLMVILCLIFGGTAILTFPVAAPFHGLHMTWTMLTCVLGDRVPVYGMAAGGGN